MMLHIQYLNDKYDYINQRTLYALIKQKAIKQFYRPQGKKWVNINIDSIRGGGSGSYAGIERRQLII